MNEKPKTAKVEASSLWKRIPSKGFIITCLLIVIIPFAFQWARNAVLSSVSEKKIIVVQGEKPVDSNFFDSIGWVEKSSRFFGGKSLVLDTPTPPGDTYFTRYDFSIEEAGEYHFYLAGTPPGPSAIGSEWSSPFYLSIDNASPKLMTEEGLNAEWPYLFRFKYADGGYYFTKVATEQLSQDVHTASLYVNQGRIHDGHYTLYVDALIIAPSHLKPEANVGKIPKDLFYE